MNKKLVTIENALSSMKREIHNLCTKVADVQKKSRLYYQIPRR